MDGVSLPALIAAQEAESLARKIPPPSLPTEYAPAIADLVKGLGALVGLSRPPPANIVVGRFGITRAVVQRVQELSRAA